MLESQAIHLRGCGCEPLAFYLKSLAILRLLSQQKDAGARGFWRNGTFHLQSQVDRDGLMKFFLEEYVPTPIVAPWNGGSGFYEGDSTDAMDAIRSSNSPRFCEYRGTIDAIIAWPEMPPTKLSIGAMMEQLRAAIGNRAGKANDAMRGLLHQVEVAAAGFPSSASVMDASIETLQSQTRLPKNPTVEEKTRANLIRLLLHPTKKVLTKLKSFHRAAGKVKLVGACRNRLGDRAVEWIDTAILIDSDQEPVFPPLLGTGGCEGRLEYTSAFMSCMVNLLLAPEKRANSEALLRNALFGDPGGELSIAAFGQYYPGRAGGFNQGAEIETKDFPINPWDFVLTLEGAIVWAGGLSRRNATHAGASLSVPFTVRSKAVGYASAAEKDNITAREVWAPLWQRSASYQEVRALFAEGRAELGRRSAANSIEFAEAAASLGVARGISQFVRYSLVKRRGDNYVALPAGKFPVQERSESDLLRQLDTILVHVDQFLQAFKKGPPARFTSARRAIDQALYDVLLQGGASRMKCLLAAVGRLERLFAERDRTKKPKLARPLGGLRPAWIAAADDGSIEIRIAAALASIGPRGDVGPLRANLCPVDPKKSYLWAKGQGQTAWHGQSLTARLAATMDRRMMDAGRLNCQGNPLWGSISISAEDALAIVDGDLDETLLEDLLFGLCWVDFRSMGSLGNELRDRWRVPLKPRIVPRSWSLLKLLFLPGGVPVGEREIEVRPEPSIVALLHAGRLGDACRVASRRLYAAGLAPVESRFPDDADAARMTAALLVPIRDTRKIVKQVLHINSESLQKG